MFYLSTVTIFVLIIWCIFKGGRNLENVRKQTSNSYTSDQVLQLPQDGSMNKILDHGSFYHFSESLKQNLKSQLGVLILQIVIIILFSRALGFAFTKINQPIVIGEILAGIVLGPSVLGMYFPQVSAFLFPPSSLFNLQILSQVGLILFMFIVGMELDLKTLKGNGKGVLMISHVSILLPFLLGVSLAYFLYESFAPHSASFLSFGLFMGISLSITAFPVLARVIQERGLSKTPLGSLAITCAAVDDITAWCMLAAIIAIIKVGSPSYSLYTICLASCYVLFMVFIVRPLIKKIGNIYVSRENLNKTIVALVFLILFCSAYFSEIIGIHTLFGAFVAGVIMPQNLQFKKVLTEKIEDVSLVLLLPLFFVLTGLRTHIGLLNDSHLWAICGLVTFVAIAGKFGGATISAKFAGFSWHDSLSVGALMNTRGLMELIVLNIGYDLGVLSGTIFAMLVLMAIFTTFMVGPILDLIQFVSRRKDYVKTLPSKQEFKILISFAQPSMGRTLLNLANQLRNLGQSDTKVTALHFTPSSEVLSQNALVFERESFQPIMKKADELGITIETHYKTVNNVSKEITKSLLKGKFNLLLVGAAKSLFTQNQTGGVLREILERKNSCDVCVLMDKGFNLANNILILNSPDDDLFLMKYGEAFIRQNPAVVKVFDFRNLAYYTIQTVDYDNFILVEEQNKEWNTIVNDKKYIFSFDLVIIGLNHWVSLISSKVNWVNELPSILIVKNKLE